MKSEDPSQTLLRLETGTGEEVPRAERHTTSLRPGPAATVPFIFREVSLSRPEVSFSLVFFSALFWVAVSIFMFWGHLPRTGLAPHLSKCREVSLFPFQLRKQTSIILLNLLKKLVAKAVLKTPPLFSGLRQNRLLRALFMLPQERPPFSKSVGGWVLPEHFPVSSYTHAG